MSSKEEVSEFEKEGQSLRKKEVIDSKEEVGGLEKIVSSKERMSSEEEDIFIQSHYKFGAWYQDNQ